MKKPVLFLVLLLAPVSALAQETTLTAQSSVTSVIVYPDRAMVTRKATVQLTEGPYQVVFPDLPGEALPESLRVSGQGTAKARLGTVESSRVFLEAAGKEDIRKLQEELQVLKDEDKKLADELAIAGKQKEFYQAIQFHNAEVWSKEITIGKLTVDDWAKVTGFLEKGQRDAAAQAQTIEVKRRELKDKMDALKKRLDEVLSGSPRERLSAAVEVEALYPGSLDLELSYVVMGASWSPLYEARADTDSGKVELTYQGQVAQRTSEDWKSVALSLSTARPAVGASPPELPPWIVGIVQPVPLKDKMMEMRAYGMAKEAPREMEALAGAPMPEVQAGVMTAQVEAAGTSVIFKAVTRQDIPSDGATHKVTLSVDSFKADFEYFTVPKLLPYAFLKGVLVNDRDYPLLAGPAAVFLGEDYLGKSAVTFTAPGGKLDLALGMDEGIRVKRELVSRNEEDTGIISKSRRITFAYKIELESFKKSGARITVLDQLPVSQQEEVVVKEIKLDPEPTERGEHGMLKWKLDIAPKEKKEIRLEFYVEYPRDKVVGGI